MNGVQKRTRVRIGRTRIVNPTGDRTTIGHVDTAAGGSAKKAMRVVLETGKGGDGGGRGRFPSIRRLVVFFPTAALLTRNPSFPETCVDTNYCPIVSRAPKPTKDPQYNLSPLSLSSAPIRPEAKGLDLCLFFERS